jgi:hypothetical protein
MHKIDWKMVAYTLPIALAIAGYFIFYLPMSRNYKECGRITLCNPPLSITEEKGNG